jgi:hypothetical protein
MGIGTFIMNILRALLGGKDETTTTTTATTTKKPCGDKRAVCIAINNYPGYNNDLKGCVNDARNWSNLLKKKFGFHIDAMLLDSQAKKKAVVKALKALVSGAKAGDILVITYSGHGTQVPDYAIGRDESDGKDEAWCLYDGYLIDDEIKKIISKLPSGVKLTVVSDSCHSGTVTRAFLGAIENTEYLKARYMPPEGDIEACNLGTLPLKNSIFNPRSGMKEVLISGCKSTEYSYDARINGKATGAFSHFAIQILKQNPKITYNDFYKKLREKLPSGSFSQTPQLEGSEESKNSLVFE